MPGLIKQDEVLKCRKITVDGKSAWRRCRKITVDGKVSGGDAEKLRLTEKCLEAMQKNYG